MQTVIEINASPVNNKCLNTQTGERAPSERERALRGLHFKTWCYCCLVIAVIIAVIKCVRPDAII